MSGGTLMQVGSPNDLHWRVVSRFVADFMGKDIWLSGRARRGGGTARAGTTLDVVPLGPSRHLLIELAGGHRVLAAEANRADHIPARGDAVMVAVPPSGCTLFPVPT